MKRIGLIIVLVGLLSQIWAGWKVEEIASFDNGIVAMTIGKGRNDDTNRIYCWTGNTIKEITYSEGDWRITQVCSLPTIGGMVLAKARNDNTVRLYVVSDSTLWEFTFTNGEWRGISFSVVDSSVKLTGLIAGPARNDDTLRLYSGIPYIGTIELTWRNNKWKATGEIYDYDASLPTAIGKGRNDGIMRLYCGFGVGANMGVGMTEWTYTNEGWMKRTSIRSDSIVGWVMGDGRNDSLMRIYGASTHVVEPEYYHVREFTYTHGGWELEIMDYNLPSSWGCFGIGDGKNQNKNYVYIVGPKGGLYEYEWEEGFWKRDTVVPDTFEWSQSKIPLSNVRSNLYHPLVIGKARNDDTNRIYYAPKMGKNLLEITWGKEGIEESSNSAKGNIPRFSLYPNPFSQEIKIEWQGILKKIPLSVEIYNAVGQKVKSSSQGFKTYRVTWDGRDTEGHFLSSGVYFCRLKVGDKSIIKKIILQRKEER